MYKRLDRAHRVIPLVLGVGTLINVGLLLSMGCQSEVFSCQSS